MNRFIEQIEPTTKYDSGVVCDIDGNYGVGFEMHGARDTFSIGQPVYDKDNNLMGWLGIGLYRDLDYHTKTRIPCEYWQICLPTEHCKEGKKIYTYWQMKERTKEDNKNGTL